ncbi:MAG: ATP-grasp domain-containing protein, partial [Actinocatenispora sp.]
MLLVPGDVLRPRRPDEHFAPEALAARDAGLTVAVVDHDALADGRADAAVTRVPPGEDAVYRGWMLGAGRYAGFAAALAARGTTLRTTPEQYRRAHELPGWYDALAPLTPRSVWTSGDDRAGFDQARAELGTGAAVLRDHTKSMKHYWHEAMYVPDLADADAAWRVAARLRELRGDDFTGGFVLRRFEEFASAEVRTWWVGGDCVLVGAHPDTPDDPPPADLDLTPLVPLVASLNLPFVTVDLARRADSAQRADSVRRAGSARRADPARRSDDVWRIVELGDGQVSDRPVSLAPDALIAALHPGR